MSDVLRSTMDELRQGLQQIYRSRLKGVYIFGSQARGEATPDSDREEAVPA
ncbi:MAG: nucleotidyltransferase domain-containing protein [Planctomycetes bacterium]|nr:nucleotidyltransferase domain-containing protein [Planctomycetota bacterium]